MGLFGNIIDTIGKSTIGKAVFKPGGIVDTITKPIQYVGAIVANPITTVTQGPQAAMKQAQNDSIEKSTGKVLLTTGVIAASVVTGGTSAGRAAVTTVAKALVPKTPTAIITTALVAPVVATAVLTNPKGAVKTVSKIVDTQIDAGKLLAEPTVEKAKEFVEEHPVAVGAAATGAALLVGKGVSAAVGAYTNYQNTKAVKENTEALANDAVLPTTTNNPSTSKDTIKLLDTAPQNNSSLVPVTPQTTSLTKTSSTTVKRRRASSPRNSPQSINQKVNVIIGNKTYLKRSVYN
jgi:hypothetical protein